MKHFLLFSQAMRLKHITLIILTCVLPFTAQAEVIRINFQSEDSAPPMRTAVVYHADMGKAFGDRGKGLTYGFSEDRSRWGKRRYTHPDCRWDSLIETGGRDWKLALPNGNYLVTLVAGDPEKDTNTAITINNKSYPAPAGRFNELVATPVTIMDGFLTVKSEKKDNLESCLCFIEVAPATEGFPVDPRPDQQKQPAFPGAEGFGKYTRGGRGGDVYHVTSLNRNGPGSLAWGLHSIYGDHPRTIVFDISGHIGAAIDDPGFRRVAANNLTIAGQTAPGKGITIRDKGLNFFNSSNLIMRYLRIRVGDENKKKGQAPDAMSAEDNNGVILDHLSMSWAIDGTMDTRRMGPFTVQWCIFAETLNNSLHPNGAHGFLMSWRGVNHNTSIHHNLFTTGTSRHPSLGDGGMSLNKAGVIIDFRNNINDKIGGGPMKAGELNINLVNNTFLIGKGVEGKGSFISVQALASRAWMAGNDWIARDPEAQSNCANITKDNYLGAYFQYADGLTRDGFESKSAFELGEFEPTTQSAKQAYEAVLKHAGASRVRDAVDERIAEYVRNGTGRIIDSQSEVGGWDNYPSETRPANFDTDQDGMPDEWETRQGLNPNDSNDGNGDLDKDGYTNLEEYLNGLVEQNQ